MRLGQGLEERPVLMRTSRVCVRGRRPDLISEPTAPPLPPPAPIEPLAFRKRTAARLLDISERTIERLLAAGKFPRPDAYAGKCPLWTRATLETWVREGGGRIA